MNRQVGIALTVVSCLALVGIGALVDVVGGVTVRTNVAPDTVSLTVFDPLLPGAVVTPTWTVASTDVKRPVLLVLVTATKEYTLAQTNFFAGRVRAQVPCDIAAGDARLELVGEQEGDRISSVAVEVLSPGPDCVR